MQEEFLEDELFFKDSGMDQDSVSELIEGYYKLLNGRNADGKITNIPSHLLIVNPFLPQVGINLCVGTHEDQTDNSCIFFNYNSLGFHGIYRYYRNVPGFTNGEIQLLFQVKFPNDYTSDNPNPLNFSDDPTNVITGIALVDNKLYWNQPNDKPKMLDAARSNVTRKRLRWNMLLNRTNFVASIAVNGIITYTLKVYKSGNPVPIHTFVWTSAPASNTYALRVADFVAAYNASPLTMAQFHLINKSDYVQIEMSKEGDFYIDLSETLASDLSTVRISLVTPDNYYPERDSTLPVSYSTFKIDLISRIRYPSLIEPACLYKTDATRLSNLVKGKVFQFRTRYNYFDYSLSCLGSISNIAPNIMLNVDTSQIINNYIEIDFTDWRLSDPSLVSIVRTVDILFREHNTGVWRIAATLYPYEFAGPGQQVFKFFNDGNYAVIDDAQAVKPYDSVPLTAKALEIVGDRLFDGGIKEGYNKIPINAKIDVAYKAQVNPSLYTIKGIAFIYNVFDMSGSVFLYSIPISYQYNQGIYSLTNQNNNLAYGGFCGATSQPGNSDDYAFYVRDIIDPAGPGGTDFAPVRIPLAGWTFYLAGTDFKGTSKQKEAWYDGTQQHIIDKAYYNCNTLAERTDYRNKLFPNDGANEPNYPCFNPFGLGINAVDQNGNYIGRQAGLPATKVYQEWEIPNVPEGTYVLRVASHLITNADLNSGTLDYQKTSTNALSVAGSDMFEIIIVVGPSTADANNNVYVGASVIADLVKPEIGNNGTSNGQKFNMQCGYITDHDKTNLNSGSTYNELLTDTKIDNAIVKVGLTHAVTPLLAQEMYYTPFVNAYQWNFRRWSPSVSGWSDIFTRCDHNGYFFYGVWSYCKPTVINAETSGVTLTLSINKDNYGNAWAPKPFSEGGTLAVFRNIDDTISSDNRTLIIGTISSPTLVPQGGVVIVNEWGAVTQSDIFGNFNIITYDRKVLSSTVDGTRDGNLIFSSSSLIYAFTIIGPVVALPTLIIGLGVGEYNYATPYYFGNKGVSSVIIPEFTSAMKRGWDGQFGIVYYNEADQKCAVCTIDALQKHILFYTEKDPATGLQVNTGYPILTWTIYHRPPEWATKYQWVRQLNQQMNSWLQWVANSVAYINDNDDGTTYATPTDPSATMCKINLDNIGYYTINKHPNAVINFPFQKGDRLRPILDAKNNLFAQYYEFEIIKVIGTDVYIYKDVTITFEKGTLFEMFSPRGDEEIKVYYEFGECYEVKTAVIQGVRQKYHAGPTQDQTYGPVPTQAVTPAIGVFKTGDAYYRTRELQIGCILATDIAPNQASTEGNIIRFIDDQSVSDFYESRDSSIGRVNLEFGIREIYRPSAERFTNRYLSGTETNGLSSNEPLNEKQFSSDFGLITKLILVSNNVLKAIFSNSWQVNQYINQGVLREASGQSLIAISDDVIPQTNINERTFGTQHPESIVLNTQGDLFGWDEKAAVYWRSSGNGLVAASAYQMDSYFDSISAARIKPGYVTKNPGVYDLGNGQVLQTFSNQWTNINKLPKAVMCLNDHVSPINISLIAYPSNVTLISVTNASDPNLSTSELTKKLINLGVSSHGFTASINTNGCVEVFAPQVSSLYSLGTLVLSFGTKNSFTFQFDEGLKIFPAKLPNETISFTIAEKGTPQNRWPQFYSFTPEHYGRIRNNTIGFVNGELWLHNQGPDYNMFYGVYYPLQLTLVFKKDFQKNKVYKAFSYNSRSLDFYVPIATTPVTGSYPTGQFTKISKANFKAIEAAVYAKMNNDGNDTRFATQVDAIMSGRPMRGHYIKVVLENDSRESVELLSTKIIYFYSELS